ncbi:glycosyltransferase family 4 protein [uncultured Roseobacter sp.]|uniref:glycosyltransferase family 4 protein n=1 Tax=uncultured Roseobacter sp. TaxID=114847 RepID=UPI00263A311B|nr:glycosyltransferase family 4 protein [uncultured Roseobacter sp.]
MKILVVSGMFPPIQTGTAFYARNLAQVFQKQGHEVTVVGLRTADPVADKAVADAAGLKVHRLPAWTLPLAGFFKYFQLSSWNPRNWLRLRRIARESDAHVVLLVNHYLDIAFPAIFAARSIKVPLVCSVGTQLQSLNPRRNKILNILDWIICGRLIFPFCAKLIAWDSQILAYLEDVQGSRIRRKTVILTYGANGDIDALAKRPHAYDTPKVILGVGAVSEQRSFVPLVAAFSKIADEFPDLTLRIVGHVYYDAARRLAREAGVEDRVIFLGERPHATVLQEMEQADLFYSSLTGKYVGLGTATIEAMLLGLPTMANVPLDLLGQHKLVDKEHLFQLTTTDPERIASRLRAVLPNVVLRERVGHGGRAFVATHMDWDAVARDMVIEFKDIIEARSK